MTDEIGDIQQRLVRQAFDYHEDGYLMWRKSNTRRLKDEMAGYRRANGYWYVKFHSRKWLLHRLIWMWHNGAPIPEFLDHIDTNPSNNRISNLRPASHSQNGANQQKPRKNNSSGYKGVHWHRGAWEARISFKGTRIALGRFPTPRLAAEAYKGAARELFGEFAGPGGPPC